MGTPVGCTHTADVESLYNVLSGARAAERGCIDVGALFNFDKPNVYCIVSILYRIL